MDLHTLMSFKWSIMGPEFIILGVAVILSLLDLLMPRKQSRKMLGWIAIAAVFAAMASLAGLVGIHVTSILDDTFRLDSFAIAFKFILLAGSVLVLFMAVSYEPKEGIEEYRGEFYYLFLTALLGAMVMSSSGDLITLFVGLETLSISSYILVGIRKHHLQSNESAMKYVINGGISTAITLFGMSYVYGLTGSTNLISIATQLSTLTDPQHIYLLGIAFLMIFVGLSFKISAAPYHMWAPDVYQGAPTPVTAFLSVVSKTAGFIIIVRILLSVFGLASTAGPGSAPILLKMQDYISFVAGATMVIGNVVALRQSNIKRLFAYSSISHAGYILVALASMNYFMFDAIWYYLLAYVFMNLGAFAVIQLVTEKTGSEKIDRICRPVPPLTGFGGGDGNFNSFISRISRHSGLYREAEHLYGHVLRFKPALYHRFDYDCDNGRFIFLLFWHHGANVFPSGTGRRKIQPNSIWHRDCHSCGCRWNRSAWIAPNMALDFLHNHFNQFQDFLQ